MARFERAITRIALLGGVPAVAATIWLLWSGDHTPQVRWTVAAAVVLVWLAAAFVLRERVVRPLQTLSNILAAVREQDYSLRARRSSPDDALGLAMFELNVLTDELKERRLGAMEATALLGRVMEEIDVAVFAFDEAETLRLVNRSGEHLLGKPGDAVLGKTAAALGLAQCLRGEAPRVLELALPGAAGRWEVRRGVFRQGGRPHQFVLLADVSRALREEERQAWQRLIRVLGHEINNSLTPIKSVAQQLQAALGRNGGGTRNSAETGPGRGRAATRAGAGSDDLRRGLELIAGRSESLSRFLAAYARLARLPPPKPGAVRVDEWVRRVARLETRVPVEVRPGPDVTLTADGDQLDQLLINLVRNAADAVLGAGGGRVSVEWALTGGYLEVRVLDDGPGLAETANLFVPFFTTKPEGSGIGLALARQIAEAHGGTVALVNRRDAAGCEARIRIPLRSPRVAQR